MLQITLYKDVILNNSYQNVFSLGKYENTSKSVLEKYLEGKEFFNFYVPEVYYENNGEIIFDYILVKNHQGNEIYEYNYMKIEEYDDITENKRLTRYCFINSISIKNGCVYVNYEEDVWSSYSDKIHNITECYLSRSRVLNYSTQYSINLRGLPKEYDGNNKLELIPLTEEGEETGYGVQIILEVQFYDLHSQGDETTRWSEFYQYGRNNSTTGVDYYDIDKYFTYEQAINAIVFKILPAVSIGSTAFWNSVSGVDFEHKFVVGNIYIVPAWFNLRTQTRENILQYGCRFIKSTQYNFEGNQYTGGVLLKFHEGICYTKTVENDYKNLCVGLLTNNIQLKNNGTSCDLDVKIIKDNFSLHFYFNVLNQLVEITNDFLLEIPYSIITSEELSQHKITLQMKELNYKSAIQKLQYKNVEEGSNVIFGSMQAGLPGLKNFFKGSSRQISGMTNLMVNTEEQHRLKEENALAHAPVYSYNKGTFTNTTNKFNSINGIILLRLVPDNENYVKKFINNFGYEVYEFVNTEIFNHMHINGYTTFIQRDIHYNVIKFDNSNVSGSFPKEIADTLNDILESGVKIWYDYQMTEDNYVI